jgi:hypothetical protein
MRSVLDYVIRIIKEGKGDREMVDSLKALKSTVGNIMGVAGAFAGAWAAVDKVVGESERYFTGLTDKVRTFHDLTGMTTQDSSRLIEVFDDMGISQDKVTTAFKFAEKNGFKPTIESILELQKQYQALGAGQERVAFLQKEFGKSGVELQKFFELGDVAQRLQNVTPGKIISEEDLANVREYREALDELNDLKESMQANVGRITIPIKIAILKEINEEFNPTSQTNTVRQQVQQQNAANIGGFGGGKGGATHISAQVNIQKEIIANNEAILMGIDAQTAAYTEMARRAEVAGNAGKKRNAYVELQGASREYLQIQNEIAIKNDEIARKLNAGYSETGATVKGLKEELRGLLGQSDEIQASMTKSQATISSGLITTVDEFKSLLDFSGKYMSTQDAIAAKEAEIATARKQGYSDTGQKLTGLKGELAGLQDQQKQFMDQFLLQMLMMSGVPADTLMALAQGMGMISTEAYDAYANAKILADVIGTIPANQVKTFEYYVKLTGDAERALWLLQNTNIPINYEFGGTTPVEKASGGPLAPVTKVGEQGFEYVINGVVIPHAAAVWLERAGVLGTPMALGGVMPQPDQAIGSQVAPSGIRRSTTRTPTSGSWVTDVSGSGNKADYSFVASGVAVDAAAVAAETAAATAQSIAPVSATLQQATAATISQGAQTQAAIQQTGAAQVAASGDIVSAVNGLPNRLADIMTDAIRQVLQYNA